MKPSREEDQLLESVERGEWRSSAAKERELAQLRQAARNTLGKGKNINIRLSEADLLALKRKSAESGIPYQTIVSALIHRYATGRIKLEI